METNRTCGECIACCTVAEVRGEDFVKPAMATCPYLNQKTKINRCLLHDTDKKPPMCVSFQCSWLRGYGSIDDHPDQVNVMISVNAINNASWIVAMDLKPDAYLTTGKQIIADIANKIDLPVIVVANKHLKKGRGDFVIIKDSLLPRSNQIKGDFIAKYTDSMNIYKLLITQP